MPLTRASRGLVGSSFHSRTVVSGPTRLTLDNCAPSICTREPGARVPPPGAWTERRGSANASQAETRSLTRQLTRTPSATSLTPRHCPSGASIGGPAQIGRVATVGLAIWPTERSSVTASSSPSTSYSNTPSPRSAVPAASTAPLAGQVTDPISDSYPSPTSSRLTTSNGARATEPVGTLGSFTRMRRR